MVEYRLKLKGGEIIDKQDKEKYGIFIYGARGEYLAYYDDEYSFCECGSVCYNDNESKFDQNDIDKIPSGLLKKLDVIEVKEQLYYIKVPYVTGYECYINEHRDKHIVIVSDKEGYDRYKTKFTKQEIEDRYPLYVNGGCMIKAEDVE